MKTHPAAFCLAVLLAGGLSIVTAQAAQKKEAGPNGGRVIATIEPRAEFLVLPDRKVQITFLDQTGKPVAPAGQTVTVTAGERSKPKTLTFVRSGNVLLSNAALPDGEAIPTVVQIRPRSDAKMVNEKFNLDLSQCGECKHAEYACICGH